jgi:hypothetical protein
MVDIEPQEQTKRVRCVIAALTPSNDFSVVRPSTELIQPHIQNASLSKYQIQVHGLHIPMCEANQRPTIS